MIGWQLQPSEGLQIKVCDEFIHNVNGYLFIFQQNITIAALEKWFNA